MATMAPLFQDHVKEAKRETEIEQFERMCKVQPPCCVRRPPATRGESRRGVAA
jgi:hypothetical protein